MAETDATSLRTLLSSSPVFWFSSERPPLNWPTHIRLRLSMKREYAYEVDSLLRIMLPSGDSLVRPLLL